MPKSLHNAIVKQVKPICRMHVPPSVRPSARWPAQLSASSPSCQCYVACNKFRVEKHFNFKRNYKISPPLNCVAFLLRCALVAFQQWAARRGEREGAVLEFAHELKCKQNKRKKQQRQQQQQENATWKRLPRVALARFKFNMQDGVEVPLALGRNCGELRAGERGRVWEREQTR